MRALFPKFCYGGTWQPLLQPTVDVAPCGIPFVQNSDTVGGKRITVTYDDADDDQVHQINDFYADNKHSEFTFHWLGDNTLSEHDFVAQFAGMPAVKTVYKGAFEVVIDFLCYEEVVV